MRLPTFYELFLIPNWGKNLQKKSFLYSFFLSPNFICLHLLWLAHIPNSQNAPLEVLAFKTVGVTLRTKDSFDFALKDFISLALSLQSSSQAVILYQTFSINIRHTLFTTRSVALPMPHSKSKVLGKPKCTNMVIAAHAFAWELLCPPCALSWIS